MKHPVIQFITAGLFFWLGALGAAASVTTGQPLPPVAISDKGECVLRDDDTAFVPWSTDSLEGKVQVVDSFPDIKVQVVDSFPDLKVQTVSSFPDDCGQWQFVDSFPDFTVQFVDSFPDFRIEFVESFPGLN